MNKKSLILLVLPAFLLGGCNKEISAADAKAKAKEIEEHEVKPEDYNALSVSMKMNESASGKIEGVQGNEKTSVEMVTEFSVDKSFLHVKTYSKHEDLLANKVDISSTEVWSYLKDDIFYTATAVGDGQTEQKTYVEVPATSDAVKASFKASLDDTVKTALEGVSDDSYLDIVEDIADGKTEEGVQYSLKYYTSGDGNLTVEGSASFTDYSFEGVKGSGSGKVKYAWDKYLLNEIAVTMDFSAQDADADTDVTMAMETNEKVVFEVSVAYPDLSTFKKVVL